MVPEDHIEFVQTVWTRRPLFTYIFFGVNIFLFLLMALAGGSTKGDVLMAFGVKANSMIARGQWWRFITPMFLHIGLLHLFFNSYALWIVGPQVEKLYGPARFVILYVLTGVAGVYSSYYYHPENQSAGASGAIFGLFGVLLVFGFRYRDSIPPFFKRAVGTGVLPVILINLVIGFSLGSFIDNAAHLGGLIAGATLAAVVPFQRPGSETPSIFRSIQMLLLATIVVSFYYVERNYDGPNLSLRNLRGNFSSRSSLDTFIDTINNAQKSFEASARELGSSRPDQLASLKADTAKSIDQLRKIPSISSKSNELTASLLRVMQDQYELIQDIERAGTITFGHTVQLKENIRIYGDVKEGFSKWVQDEGERYGITEKN